MADEYADIIDHMRSIYLRDDRTWIVSVSGGKDSTACLQLLYYMLRGIPQRDRRTVYVMYSVVQVESPASAACGKYLLDAVQHAATRDCLPIQTVCIETPVSKTYWVTVIGKGLSPPTWRFQWCTTAMKISPLNRYIRQNIASKGDIMYIVGSRMHESRRRKRSMQNHDLDDGDHISPHATLLNAYVYAPIASWYDADVYTYLRSVPSPWGNDNGAYLDAYYGRGSEGWLPGCRGSLRPDSGHRGVFGRTGCWTCTVINRDVSLEKYIACGHAELKPLLDYRQLLLHVCTDMSTRMLHPVTGRPSFISPEWRRELLDRLLALRRDHPDLDAWCVAHGYDLITPAEIAEIQRIWAEQGI